MEKIKEFLQKIKSIKNFEIILCLIIIAVALLIYFSVSPKEKSNDEQEVVATENSLTDGLEARLGNILSKIEGVGEVDVLITFETTAEQITATTNNSHSTTTQNGDNSTTTSTSTDTPIISNQNVIVVAEGADEAKVKLQILSAVSTALNINQNSIQIYTRRDL